jgi:sulfonate transport system substrate-binding protein
VPKTLNVGYIGATKQNIPNSPEGWGYKIGILAEELQKYGITDIKFVGFPNGPDLSESLISGRLDIGMLGDTPAILARSTGAKTRLIAQAAVGNNAYIIGKKNGPKTLADLAGKTVATQKGSYMHRYLAAILKQEGVKDVKIIHLLAPDAEAALSRGEIDATTSSGINALKLIDQGYANIDEASRNPSLTGTNATVVSEEYLSKFPDFHKVWNEARQKALKNIQTRPDEFYAFLSENGGNPVELVKQATPLTDYKEQAFTDEGIKQREGTKAFLVEEKLAAKDFNLQDWILR